MTKIIDDQNISKIDADRFPKLAKATELADNYKIRAEKAEAKLKAEVGSSKKSTEVGSSKKSKSKGELDYAQKAFLIANGIKGTEEQELVLDVMSATGKDLDEVVENKYFINDLKDLREAKAVNEATPPSSGRSPTSSPKSEVGYWVAKGEMPPVDQPKLRQEFVQARMKAQTDGNPFSSNPIVGGTRK